MSIVTTEWLKIKKYPAFWLIFGITALSYPGINWMFYQVYLEVMGKETAAAQLAKYYLGGSPFAFPEVWHTVAFASSLFVFIPSVVIIMLITNEYTYKTQRQNIIDGWSRNNFMRAKLIDVFIISMLITLLYVIVCLVIGFLSTEPNEKPDIWSQSYYTGLFALQTFAQLSIAFLIGFLVRKAFLALGIFLVYYFPVEPLIVGYVENYHNDEARFMPLEISDRMIPRPAFIGQLDTEAYTKALSQMNLHIFLTILLLFIVWGICFWLINRKDL